MKRFSDFFYGAGPRIDVNEVFPPNHIEPEGPILVSTASGIAAVAVATRLLQALARRGATRVRLSELDALLQHCARALDAGSLSHCDDEVLRILSWLESPPHDEAVPEIPELAVMHEADVSARVATLAYAQAHALDVELQYYDLHRKTWPRTFGTVVRVEETDDGPVLLLDQDGIVVEIECAQIRWVMPVSARRRPRKSPAADVLTFPKR